ncbi:unnamed protein product, partial [Musa acuminata subsp. burmannicoides]
HSPSFGEPVILIQPGGRRWWETKCWSLVGNTRGATTSWWRSHIYEPQLACPSILQVQIKF